MPLREQRLYRNWINGSVSGGRNLYEVFAPTLRDESYRKGLDAMLKRIEFQCGLAYGTLSDPQNVDKTAEEIRSSKQRSYTTVKDLQRALGHSTHRSGLCCERPAGCRMAQRCVGSSAGRVQCNLRFR